MADRPKASDNTRRRIVDSTLAMLQERDLADINVGEIAAVAGVSRQTFYYHFHGIFEVFMSVIEGEMRFTYPRITGRFFSSPYECVLDYCRAVGKHKDIFYKFVFSPYRDNLIEDFRTYLHGVCEGAVRYIMGDGCQDDIVDVFARFHADGYIPIVHEWVESRMEIDLEERMSVLASGFHRLFSSTVFSRASENRI